MEHNALSEIVARRYEEIRGLRSAGVEPYPHRFKPTHSAAAAAAAPADTAVVCAGRVMQLRLMGKAAFVHILDVSGKLQAYVKKDEVGESAYEIFKKHVHVGDYIGISGKMFVTHTNEVTVKAEKVELLAKAIRPLPEKWHGLHDTEVRFRARHLDLIANKEARDIFIMRSKLLRAVRGTLDGAGFLEVETPTLCQSAGGASATPFETFHNALKLPMFMRIATELYLKRLVIGGLDRVYEIGKVFRNEGIDTRHNPEFTMLEAYCAYSDYHGMAQLFEDIVSACVEATGIESVEYRGKKISLKPPFRRLYMPELWKEQYGFDMHEILQGKSFNRPRLLELAKKHHVEHSDDTPSAKIFERFFDSKIMPLLHEPAFVLDHPTAITPLAKCKPGDESIVERFEFFAGTEEIANAYTELNDPEDQMGRLAEQMHQKQAEKNQETDVIDRDFVEAMESGMPPTGGIGIGIDRLTMLFSGNPTIREVILFPTLKPEVVKTEDKPDPEHSPA